MEDAWWLLGPVWSLLPLAVGAMVIAWAVLAAVRSRTGMGRPEAILRAGIDVSFVAAVVTILILTLGRRGGGQGSVVFVPFGEYAPRGALAQNVENVVMFIPIGLLMALRWGWVDSLGRVIGVSAAFSVAIEVLQYTLPTSRQSSVTDVLMNTLGGAVGYLILRLILAVLQRR